MPRGLTDGKFTLVLKENTRSSGGARREITCWHQAEESNANGGGFRRLMPASDLPTCTTRRAGVFLLYSTYLWNNKQQVMSINLTTWSTMQYHVVVDHIVFYVIHSQVRYKGNGLVPSGNKSLPEPTLTPIVVAIWRHYTKLSSC